MREVAFIVFVSVILLATCSAPEINAAPADIGVPVPPLEHAPFDPTQEEPIPMAATEMIVQPKLPESSFVAQTYINETAGFALDYPAQWTVNETVIGPRGMEAQFLSSPELAELAILPEGATRLSATIYQWDPKNDISAYVAHWKTAWEASGFRILEENQLVLDLGFPSMQFTVQTPEAPVVFLVTALSDQYLVLSGEGNLELVKEIMQSLRLIEVKQNSQKSFRRVPAKPPCRAAGLLPNGLLKYLIECGSNDA